jgi:saccharopine dehydrogenase-like NADP-dependent oxidoreductase
VLIEALGRHLPRSTDDVVLVRVWAEARRDGRRIAAGHQIVDRHDGRFSALARTTAFPAAALAHLLVEGELGLVGATTMDDAVAARSLLSLVEETGIRVEDWTPPGI